MKRRKNTLLSTTTILKAAAGHAPTHHALPAMIRTAFPAFSTPAVLHQTHEVLAELEETEGDAALDADDEEEEEYVYNPLKLPLGLHPQTLLFYIPG
jgi:hypothetical protein